MTMLFKGLDQLCGSRFLKYDFVKWYNYLTCNMVNCMDNLFR